MSIFDDILLFVISLSILTCSHLGVEVEHLKVGVTLLRFSLTNLLPLLTLSTRWRRHIFRSCFVLASRRTNQYLVIIRVPIAWRQCLKLSIHSLNRTEIETYWFTFSFTTCTTIFIRRHCHLAHNPKRVPPATICKLNHVSVLLDAGPSTCASAKPILDYCLLQSRFKRNLTLHPLTIPCLLQTFLSYLCPFIFSRAIWILKLFTPLLIVLQLSSPSRLVKILQRHHLSCCSSFLRTFFVLWLRFEWALRVHCKIIYKLLTPSILDSLNKAVLIKFKFEKHF